MPKDDRVYAGHMLDMAEKIQELSAENDGLDFSCDQALLYALAHLVQVIGEAARRVSPEFRQRHPQVPWAEIIGMRNKVVHDYLDLDEDILRAVVKGDIPKLIEELKKIGSSPMSVGDFR
ncbi:DUF86 domain-containing protein [candidate division TA06 bacterium]|uniref:DUF86 domain-containing protein n=1 Tax=candidate division TA06 bacterium TaxID=2250710 RepID=A0A933IAT3_UNCT6|nr:DUF86 domain-containing protein [candidate division TA06 bacterium]